MSSEQIYRSVCKPAKKKSYLRSHLARGKEAAHILLSGRFHLFAPITMASILCARRRVPSLFSAGLMFVQGGTGSLLVHTLKKHHHHWAICLNLVLFKNNLLTPVLVAGAC